MKTKIKKRSIDELRQVKDTNYVAPLSHDQAQDRGNKEDALQHLLKGHYILFKNYENSDSDQYVLSWISTLCE